MPALIALFLYALLPIVRNTHARPAHGVPARLGAGRAVARPDAGPEPARTCSCRLRCRRSLAGIKTAAVINVGTATMAAFIGAGGFGERIVAGLAVNDSATMLAGALPAAVLALLVQAASTWSSAG